MNIRLLKLGAIMVVLVLGSGVALAGGVQDIEEDLPVTIDSAYPIGYLGRELQLFLRYEHDEEGLEAFRSELRLELGFPRNGEIKLAVPVTWGSGEPNGVREVRGEFLYNLNQETLWLPAFSLAGGLYTPTGPHTHGFDPFAKVLITKTISGCTNTFQQVHFNWDYRFNDQVRSGERGYETTVALGYSRRIRSDLLFVTDVVRRWRLMEDQEENLAEFGLRYQLTPLIILSAGTGFGFGDESPDARVTVGMQVAF